MTQNMALRSVKSGKNKGAKGKREQKSCFLVFNNVSLLTRKQTIPRLEVIG